MKHVLIPTDFSIPSLNSVHAAIASNGEEKLKITLFHLLEQATDFSGMLFRPTRNRHLNMIPEDFNDACQILQNRYGSVIGTMQVKFGFGNTAAYLGNFLEGLKAHEVVINEDVKLKPACRDSVDIIPLLKRMPVPVTVINDQAIRKQHTDLNMINMMKGNELKIPKVSAYAVEK